MQIKLSNGFKLNIEKSVVTDWRFVQAVAYSESKDEIKRLKGVVELADVLLGDQKEDLMDKIAKDNNGAVPTEKVSEIISEIILKLKDEEDTKK